MKREREIPFTGKGIQYVFAVASGKGGVGKSTVALNTAIALQSIGYQVGILDADIYGPSLGKMLGIDDTVVPEIIQKEGKHYYVPIEAYGLRMMSMSVLTSERTAVVWRGPMASSAFRQMLTKTDWGELDFLIMDLPPGTGDIPLTVVQKGKLSGGIIVTTPQDVALLDVCRAIEMYKKLDIPVWGMVENMAYHVCGQCGHKEHLFGEGGAMRLFEEYALDILGTIPLAKRICDSGDQGTPIASSTSDSVFVEAYRQIARNVVERAQRKRAVSFEKEEKGSIPSVMLD